MQPTAPAVPTRSSPYRFHFAERKAIKKGSEKGPKQAASKGSNFQGFSLLPAFEDLAWKVAPAKSLCLAGPSAKLCKHWAQKVCDVAEQRVRSAFSPRVEGLLRSTAARRNQVGAVGGALGSVPLLLALAGSDAEDHDATMSLVETLVREKMPTASTALIHPGQLRSLSYANRKIMEKLRREEETEECREEDEEAEEDDEDETLEDLQLSLCNGSAASGDALTVLFFQAVDAAPKDVLRRVLSFWHASCEESGMPLLVVLG